MIPDNQPERRWVDHPAYRGPERRVTSEKAFERAVTEAAAEAAQRVAKIHRVRLVRQTALASLVVSAVVALVVALLVKAANDTLVRNQARYNCGLVTQLTSAMGDFVRSDVNARLAQARTSITPKLLKDLERVIPVADLRVLASQSAKAGTATAVHWQTEVIPKLSRLAAVNCSSKLP